MGEKAFMEGCNVMSSGVVYVEGGEVVVGPKFSGFNHSSPRLQPYLSKEYIRHNLVIRALNAENVMTPSY